MRKRKGETRKSSPPDFVDKRKANVLEEVKEKDEGRPRRNAARKANKDFVSGDDYCANGNEQNDEAIAQSLQEEEDEY